MKYEKLRNYIKSQGMTLKDFAIKVLDVRPQTCDYKYRGIAKFTIKQINITKKYFNLSNKQVFEFFLNESCETTNNDKTKFTS